MPISSPWGKERKDFERVVATPAKGLTLRGLTRLLRPARHVDSATVPFLFIGVTLAARGRSDGGDAGKG